MPPFLHTFGRCNAMAHPIPFPVPSNQLLHQIADETDPAPREHLIDEFARAHDGAYKS